MTRIVVLTLVGIRKQIRVAIDWSLVRFVPRDSAITRPTPRCPICPRAAPRTEPRAA